MAEDTENKKGDSTSPFPALEREVLLYWKEKGIFKKTLSKVSPKGEYVFYDGPPFATGEPHYGHILAGTIKDVIPRFKTMQGYHVARRWGWDCHGLPVENLVEKELGLKTKKDIEDFGIEQFNEKARSSVMRYADTWRDFIPRVGRFVDMENDYKTMDASYTESIWWAFRKLHEDGLLYRGFKPMHICPRCETTLSNFEVTQGYKDIKDSSAFVKFELSDEPGTYFLAWTTTPWTLPGNVALAVQPSVSYVVVVVGGEALLVAKDRVEQLFGVEAVITKTYTGLELVGRSYKPLFPYYSNDSKLKNKEHGWKVYGADFVTTEDGTGIVHIAPAFGEDDLLLGQKEQLPFVQHVGMDGRFKDEVVDFKGEPVKPKGRHTETDKKIIAFLQARGLLFKEEEINHSYPHCWRCETPLLNYAATSWFVNVTSMKDRLVAENEKIQWVPSDVGEGRFGKWLLGARDWAISRSRYWGAPLPVWTCDSCGNDEIVGSISDMKRRIPKRNTYLIMRHGEAENNTGRFVSSAVDAPVHLTEKGKSQVQATATKLRGKHIDVIVSSPVMRTKETADIVRQELGLPEEVVVYDKRFREIEGGEFEGKSIDAYRAFFKEHGSRFITPAPNGECQADVRTRVVEALEAIDAQYEGKTILIISHETPLWLIEMVAAPYDRRQMEALWHASPQDYIANAELREVSFVPLPHNASGEIDLHRPYIDEVVFSCSCGGLMRRITDVFDCWFESGAMPFASNHFLGEDKETFAPSRSFGYPADFIAEGLDQTRGWFYSLIVLGTALFGHSPYKKVIVNGLILAENGQKMSKRLKNYPDPLLLVDTYGADALRLYLLSSPVVHGEDLRFSERGVKEIAGKTLGRLHNCLSFLELQAPETKAPSVRPESEHILDRWMFARLAETEQSILEAVEAGELDRSVRALHGFVDDLSVWYVRRSRDRFKQGAGPLRSVAATSLAYILSETAKLFAPFAPFYAEYMYRKLVGEEALSVHLASWPVYPHLTEGERGLLLEMADARVLVSKALEARAAANIKVRQPLSVLSVKRVAETLSSEMRNVIAEEVNVKEVVCNSDQADDIVLDIKITPELKTEGLLREFVRVVQDARKRSLLRQGDMAVLRIFADNSARAFLEPFVTEVSTIASIKEIRWETVDGPEVEIDGRVFRCAVVKV